MDNYAKLLHISKMESFRKVFMRERYRHSARLFGMVLEIEFKLNLSVLFEVIVNFNLPK